MPIRQWQTCQKQTSVAKHLTCPSFVRLRDLNQSAMSYPSVKMWVKSTLLEYPQTTMAMC